MGEFLNYCPVIAVDGTVMKAYDTNRLLQQLKRAYAERAVPVSYTHLDVYKRQAQHRQREKVKTKDRGVEL